MHFQCMIAKTGVSYYCLQKSGWLFFPGRPHYWAHGFPMKTFHENLNVTSYYAKDTLILKMAAVSM